MVGKLWGIHNDYLTDELRDGGFVSVGWDEVGDLREAGTDREALKATLTATYPKAKVGAIRLWAGILLRFRDVIAEGDIVISPNKRDRTLDFGRVTGPYFRDERAAAHRNRRPVEWLVTDVPRDDFSQPALYEIGSAATLFAVRNNEEEFLAHVRGDAPPVSDTDVDDDAIELSEDEPNADRVDTFTRDFVVNQLRDMDPFDFEHFVAGVLTAMGYRASATRARGDGGVDVIASRDALSIEPPIIKVQCKRTTSSIGSPDVQKLAGALAHGGSELGLFVTLGAYTNDALHLERTRQDLRLINGTQLVDLVFDHYEELDAEWKRLLPLRRVYAVDGETAGL